MREDLIRNTEPVVFRTLLGFVLFGIVCATGGCGSPSSAPSPGTGGGPNGKGGSASGSGGSFVGTGGSTASGGGTSGTGGSTATGGAGGNPSGTAGVSGSGGAMTGGAAPRTGGAGAGGTGGSGGRGGGSGGGATGGAGGPLGRFSFFVASIRRLRQLSGSQNGFGGDLRYGETGDGAGLRGADKICAEIAEMSMAGSGAKGWRAFLSAPAMGASPKINAIERIGNGPWYDRMGRLFSMSKANLIGFRPSDIDPAIKNDFPNEDGIPNHNPDGTGTVDNHDMLTGSDANGMLYTATANPTCDGWTNKTGSAGRPRVGHAWPRMPSSSNTCMGGAGSSGCYGHWMSSLDEAGCGAGVNLVDAGGPVLSDPTVGSGGGYGGFYCFALTP